MEGNGNGLNVREVECTNPLIAPQRSEMQGQCTINTTQRGGFKYIAQSGGLARKHNTTSTRPCVYQKMEKPLLYQQQTSWLSGNQGYMQCNYTLVVIMIYSKLLKYCCVIYTMLSYLLTFLSIQISALWGYSRILTW